MISLDLSSAINFSHHRHGWGYCCNGLKKIHSKSGIYCDTFVESSFLWRLNEYYISNIQLNMPYRKKWIGFLHNPPNAPDWFDYSNSPISLINNCLFKESLKNCVCLISLSAYLKNWIQPHVAVPVFDVKHPTKLDISKWNPDNFTKQKYIPIVQIGYWLRNLNFIRDINCNSRYTKIWLSSSYTQAMNLLSIQNSTDIKARELQYRWNGISIIEKLSNALYDDLMTRCVVCLDLYDSSANNAVIECISRNTPLIINKIPAVVEYLGEEYPLYFYNSEDVKFMIEDHDLILKAHQYLKNMNKNFLSLTKFISDTNNAVESVI